ncbi:MAG: ABC transporter substrate-binding protein [Pseudomonadota bacterium]
MNLRLRVPALATTALAVGWVSAAQADPITVVSWGGQYTLSQVEAYHKPFMEQTGIRIISEDYTGDVSTIVAQVRAGNVTWDIVDVELSDAIRLCDEGLLHEIDWSVLPPAPDGTPAEDDFIAGALQDCAVATIVWSNVFAYDTTKFETGPTHIADFFDTEAFPGKRGLRKWPKGIMEMALMADGVPADEVYDVLATDEGLDRAFAQLERIKDDIVWWEAGSQAPQLLADGEVVMTHAYNGRIYGAQLEGAPFEVVWSGQVMDLDLWVIPEGTQNLESAMEFLTFSTDTQRLADQAQWISYGPARQSSFPLVAEEMQPHMPTNPANMELYVVSDAEFWADRQEEINQRFNAWLLN